MCEIAENIGRAEVSTSFTYRLLQRLDMLAGGGRVGDLIRQVVSLLANETSWKDDESRRTLCFAGIVRDDGENRQKSTQKASVVTTIVAKCSKRSAFSIGFVRMQTGLHFEAFYASWISLWDKYYLQKGGQDCGLKTSLAHSEDESCASHFLNAYPVQVHATLHAR